MTPLTRLVLIGAALTPLAAHADTPSVGPLFDVDPPLYPCPQGQNVPVVASSGGGSLVVWRKYSTVTAARLAMDGTVLDPQGVALSPNVAADPAVASASGEYLVAWQDGTDVHATRLGTNGAPIAPAAFTIMSSGSNLMSWPALASDGTGFLAAWTARTSPPQIQARTVAADGTLGSTLTVATASVSDSAYVAFGGGKYLVVWTDGATNANVVAAFVDPTSATTPTVFPIAATSAYESAASVAFNGTDFLVAWYEGSSPTSTPKVVRVSTTGAVLGPPVALESAANIEHLVVSSNGAEFLCSWTELPSGTGQTRQVVGARVSASGALLDPTPAVLASGSSDDFGGGMAFDGTSYVATWKSAACSTVFAARIPQGQPPAASTPSSFAKLEQDGLSAPAVTASASNYLVAWRDLSWNNFAQKPVSLQAERIGPNGQLLDPLALLVSTITPSQVGVSLATATDGSSWLVAWADANGVADSIVGASGTISAAKVIAPSAVNGLVGAAFGGGEYALVWDTNANQPVQPVAMRVDATGTTIDTAPIPLGPAGYTLAPPAVAWDGSEFFAVWAMTPDFNSTNVFGARLGVDGKVLGTGVLPIASGAAKLGRPSIACGNGACLIVNDAANGPPVATRYAASGTPLDQTQLPMLNDASSVTWQSDHWLIVGNGPSGTALGVRIASSGTLLDPSGFQIAPAGYSGQTGVAALGDSALAVVHRGPPDMTPDRLYGAIIGPPTTTSTTTTSTSSNASSGASSGATGAGSTGASSSAGGASGSGGSSSGGSRKSSGCSCRVSDKENGGAVALAFALGCGAVWSRRRRTLIR